MEKFDRSANLHNAQIDASEFLLELQSSLIYLFETICSVIDSWTRKLWSKFTNLLYHLYINSIFHSLVFRIKTYSLNNQTRRARLLEWIQAKIPPPFRPNNFSTDWRDGIRLCALCQAIVPGCCPRYDLLSSATPLNNIKLALSLIESQLNIKPVGRKTKIECWFQLHQDITDREILECNNETKLVHLLSQLKIVETTNQIKYPGYLAQNCVVDEEKVEDGSAPTEKHLDLILDDWCFVKGMGTIVGVRTHRCRFSIFHGVHPADFALDIEILGPNGSMCSERIEVKPGMKVKKLPWQDDALHQWLTMRAAKKIRTNQTNLKIPFYREYLDDHVLVTYIPFFVGEHQISIIWQGRHVLGSPYYASIEETEYLTLDHLPGIGPRFTPGLQYPLCLLNTDQKFRHDQTGVVVRMKTLKRCIIIKDRPYDYYSYFQKQLQRSQSEQQPNSSKVMNFMRTSSLAMPDANRKSPLQTATTIDSESKPEVDDSEQRVTRKDINPFRTLPFRRRLSSDESHNASQKSHSLRQILDENNENFTKELNKMAQNLKEKLERLKKQQRK